MNTNNLGPSKYPLLLIEKDFVNLRLKFTELIAKYGISKGLLTYYSKRRNWLSKREKYYEQVNTLVSSQSIEHEAKEQFNLINALETLLKLKLTAETKVFFNTQSVKTKKDLMYLINKSKDSSTEIAKLLELLKGNATSRNEEIKPEEKQARFNRLKTFMVENWAYLAID